MPLTPDLVTILQTHRRNQIEERAIAAPGWNAAELVFCSEEGRPVDNSNLYRQYVALLRRCNLATPCIACNATGKQEKRQCAECKGHKVIASFRFHDLRHTYASLALSSGVDIFTVSRRLGHEKISTTADKYVHMYKGQSDDALALEQLLKRGV